jgi:hypothetical protein
MKTDNLIIIGAAALALFIIAGARRPATATGGGGVRWNPFSSAFGNTAASLNNGGSVPVTEIVNTALPGQNGYGWRYFSDGTVIDPSGQYYVDGQVVWSPAGGQMSYGA